jgi:hypothetical protein
MTIVQRMEHIPMRVTTGLALFFEEPRTVIVDVQMDPEMLAHVRTYFPGDRLPCHPDSTEASLARNEDIVRDSKAGRREMSPSGFPRMRWIDFMAYGGRYNPAYTRSTTWQLRAWYATRLYVVERLDRIRAAIAALCGRDSAEWV